ncbi:MAG: energy transducer TonB [Verrucomicrobia bacterium]|nr:energy transducer TonB [Verrucomicrobiota bacterium]
MKPAFFLLFLATAFLAEGHDFRQSDWLACPWPPYPPVALQKHIEGAVQVTITVDKGRITSVTTKSGPAILGSAVERWITKYWKPKPDSSSVTEIQMQFRSNGVKTHPG